MYQKRYLKLLCKIMYVIYKDHNMSYDEVKKISINIRKVNYNLREKGEVENAHHIYSLKVHIIHIYDELSQLQKKKSITKERILVLAFIDYFYEKTS